MGMGEFVPAILSRDGDGNTSHIPNSHNKQLYTSSLKHLCGETQYFISYVRMVYNL